MAFYCPESNSTYVISLLKWPQLTIPSVFPTIPSLCSEDMPLSFPISILLYSSLHGSSLPSTKPSSYLIHKTPLRVSSNVTAMTDPPPFPTLLIKSNLSPASSNALTFLLNSLRAGTICCSSLFSHTPLYT